MIIIAASLYLPEHVATMLSRAWFYYAGPDETATAAAVAGKTAANAGAGTGVVTATVAAMKGGARIEGQQVLDMLGRL